jgi:HK97 family phage major capsid protein
MSLTPEQLLQKAVLNVTGPGGDVGSVDFGGGGQSPLSIEQVTQFIEVMAAEQVMLGEVRTVTSNAAKWVESQVSFDGRIFKPGVEATRLAAGDRTKPATVGVEISTVLMRAEVPVSDEVFEDNVAGTGITASIQRLMADHGGFEIEELFVNGDISGGPDAFMQQLDGWLVQCQDNGNAIDGSTYGQDYQDIFKVLLQTLPKKFLRNRPGLRFYCPITLEQKYRDLLASRNTVLGDQLLMGNAPLSYQGIPIVPAATFDSGIDSDLTKVLLTHKDNLYAGYHRAMKFETWRDPREGATSFIITTRVDAKVAIPDATAIAYDVDVTV